MNQSESEYDGIAEAYRDSKQLSFRKYVAQLDMAESVDVVMAMYLLNYAGTKEELLNFVHVAYNRLRPGGDLSDSMTMSRMFPGELSPSPNTAMLFRIK